jgi:hypothetical protein
VSPDRWIPAAACVPALLITVPAQAAGGVSSLLFEREFQVELSARSTTDMVMPKHGLYADCQGQRWESATEKEVWSLKSRRPVRVGAVRGGNGTVTFIRTDAGEAAVESGIPAGGSVTRDSRFTRGTEPGTCGPGSPPVTDVGDDCGTKMVGYAVNLEVVAGRLWLNPSTEPGVPADQAGFRDCGISRAFGMGDGDVFRTAAARLSLDAFWRGRRTLVVRGSRTRTEVLSETTGTKTTTTTTFTVRLKPLARQRRR